jgi:hypothetical protein
MYAPRKAAMTSAVARAIGNDPDLFKLACACVETARNKDAAAVEFISTLIGAGITKTPEGARYSFDEVRAALSSY